MRVQCFIDLFGYLYFLNIDHSQENSSKRGRPASAASEDAKKSEEEPNPASRVTTRSTSRASSLKDGRTSTLSMTKLEVSPVCVDETKDVGSQEISPVPCVRNPTDSPSSEERKFDAKSSTDETEMRKMYREAVKRMLREKVSLLLESTIADLQGLHIGLRERHDRKNSKERKNMWAVNWDYVKKRRRKDEDRRRTSERSGRKKEMTSRRQDKGQAKQEHREEKNDDAALHPLEKTTEKRGRKRRNDSVEKEKEKEKEEPRT